MRKRGRDEFVLVIDIIVNTWHMLLVGRAAVAARNERLSSIFQESNANSGKTSYLSAVIVVMVKCATWLTLASASPLLNLRE
jgi:hypothetical protein